MRLIRLVAATAAALGAAAFLHVAKHPGAAEASAGPAADGGTLRLVVAGRDANCILARGELEEMIRPLRFSAGCRSIDPAFRGAAFWQERPDGVVAIVGEDGSVLGEFGVSDGAAYESFRPASPLMVLTEAL